MPLRDHFRPPLSDLRPWEGVHSAWAAKISAELNLSLLPPGFFAMPLTTQGARVEIDVATLREASAAVPDRAGAMWLPQPQWSVGVDWVARDRFEVGVFDRNTVRLVAAVELVSPGNKDRATHRQAFTGKCAGLLRQGVGLVIVDVVTERHAQLHTQLLDFLELTPPQAFAADLWAAAYRTAEDATRQRLEVWTEPLTLGGALPTLPLWITEDQAVPLDLEATYTATCAELRIG